MQSYLTSEEFNFLTAPIRLAMLSLPHDYNAMHTALKTKPAIGEWLDKVEAEYADYSPIPSFPKQLEPDVRAGVQHIFNVLSGHIDDGGCIAQSDLNILARLERTILLRRHRNAKSLGDRLTYQQNLAHFHDRNTNRRLVLGEKKDNDFPAWIKLMRLDRKTNEHGKARACTFWKVIKFDEAPLFTGMIKIPHRQARRYQFDF